MPLFLRLRSLYFSCQLFRFLERRLAPKHFLPFTNFLLKLKPCVLARRLYQLNEEIGHWGKSVLSVTGLTVSRQQQSKAVDAIVRILRRL